jgi:hypothetical protein
MAANPDAGEFSNALDEPVRAVGGLRWRAAHLSSAGELVCAHGRASQEVFLDLSACDLGSMYRASD